MIAPNMWRKVILLTNKWLKNQRHRNGHSNQNTTSGESRKIFNILRDESFSFKSALFLISVQNLFCCWARTIYFHSSEHAIQKKFYFFIFLPSHKPCVFTNCKFLVDHLCSRTTHTKKTNRARKWIRDFRETFKCGAATKSQRKQKETSAKDKKKAKRGSIKRVWFIEISFELDIVPVVLERALSS